MRCASINFYLLQIPNKMAFLYNFFLFRCTVYCSGFFFLRAHSVDIDTHSIFECYLNDILLWLLFSFIYIFLFAAPSHFGCLYLYHSFGATETDNIPFDSILYLFSVVFFFLVRWRSLMKIQYASVNGYRAYWNQVPRTKEIYQNI